MIDFNKLTQGEQYNELAQFDQTFKPAEGGKRPGLDTLADGDYDFEIAEAELVRTQKNQELILRVSLTVLNTGSSVEKVYFFRDQQNVDYLGLDLVTLGFDADQWKPPGRVFSAELPKALPRLKGIRFKGKKTTADGKKEGEKYHNLFINQKLGNQNGAAIKPIVTPAPAGTVDPGW